MTLQSEVKWSEEGKPATELSTQGKNSHEFPGFSFFTSCIPSTPMRADNVKPPHNSALSSQRTWKGAT